MCVLCESNAKIMDGEYHDYTQIEIIGNQLAIESSIENSNFDVYNDNYDYNTRISNFMILFCPLCGASLKDGD